MNNGSLGDGEDWTKCKYRKPGGLPGSAGEEVVDGGSSFAAGAHGEDDSRAASDDVAAGEDAGLGGAHGLGVGNNIVALVGFEIGRCALDEGIGCCSDADDGYVGGQNEL